MSRSTITDRFRDQLRNRARAEDRPDGKDVKCRNGLQALQTECKRLGHDWRYLPFDNYGNCKRCGCEVLT